MKTTEQHSSGTQFVVLYKVVLNVVPIAERFPKL